MSQDEKKPPVGGADVLAQIKIDLLANGSARMSSTCGARWDSSYGARPDREIPMEVALLLGELRAKHSLAGV